MHVCIKTNIPQNTYRIARLLGRGVSTIGEMLAFSNGDRFFIGVNDRHLSMFRTETFCVLGDLFLPMHDCAGDRLPIVGFVVAVCWPGLTGELAGDTVVEKIVMETMVYDGLCVIDE